MSLRPDLRSNLSTKVQSAEIGSEVEAKILAVLARHLPGSPELAMTLSREAVSDDFAAEVFRALKNPDESMFCKRVWCIFRERFPNLAGAIGPAFELSPRQQEAAGRYAKRNPRATDEEAIQYARQHFSRD